ncbi:MFS transporter [Meiothermus ruber]|uniref:Major facilitator superfamily MFS_1 n=1 Tax=Meiothermus ruber (strain ATCC 35948 / DSM 1279 / VKM B-1258 / 21) TaxID=504728 RepID=D3PKC9_MEIRD|nr:MFS transporter [Meiothermus ruber]GIW39135.1 MAG: MFS transporter [Meiothermus sp.]ADD26810.1 major facilitator superfamily MFS_1 [Meiothermus ruber DSM 1279]AGK04717.1 major facilitator superfamily protein [Meiothermus ruber DSM 1279]MCL6529811.1 MFS transporter [Meiothermus ruber]MCX7803222.1 MFS transporter [Meiothermus ruber]
MTPPPGEPRRSQILAIWEGVLAILFINWSTGMVMTGYALWLGAPPVALAILGALPMVGQMAAPLALFFRGSRKDLSANLSVFGRGLFVLALFVPLMPEAWRIPGLLTIAALSQLILAPVSVLWTSWMADLVPDQLRGRYFGLRNGLLGLVGTLGNLAAGALIDALGKPWGFLLVLGLAVGAGVGATFILRRQFEPPMTSSPPRLAEYIQPLSDRRFRGFLGFVVLFLGAVSVGGPFVFPLFLEYARMSFTQVGLWTVIAASCGLVLSPLWGRLADRIGHWQVLLFSSSVAALVLPPLWLAGGPGRLETIWLAAVFDAVAWGGIGTALTNVALQSAPPQKRNLYLAWYWTAYAVGGMLGSLLGGALGNLHKNHQLFPSPYHLPILASMGLRMVAVYYLGWRIRRDKRRALLESTAEPPSSVENKASDA